MAYSKKKYNRKWRFDNLKSWEGYISKVTNCQICNKKIYFNKHNRLSAIHFDHRNINILIKGKPTNWLSWHKKNIDNIKIWESCNFGMLCLACNRKLPTKNRINIIKYLTSQR